MDDSVPSDVPHSNPNDIPLKRCSKCGEEKPATPEFFHWRKDSNDGLRNDCKVCHSVRSQEYYNQPERKKHIRAQHKEYYNQPEVKKHVLAQQKERRTQPAVKEHQQAYQQEYRSRPDAKERKPAYQQKYRSRPGIREHRIAYQQEYHSRPEIKVQRHAYAQEYCKRPETKERQSTIQQKYRDNHPELKEYKRTYWQGYWQKYRSRPGRKERQIAHSHTRRARKRAAEGHFSSQDIQNTLIGQKEKCALCKQKLVKYHIDHIMPLFHGGSNWPYNLQLLCPTCNLRKGHKLPHEFFGSGQMRLLS